MLGNMHQHREFDGLPDLLTPGAAAYLLRVPRRYVLLAMVTGELPIRGRAGRLVIPTRQLLAAFGLPIAHQEARHDHDC